MCHTLTALLDPSKLCKRACVFLWLTDERIDWLIRLFIHLTCHWAPLLRPALLWCGPCLVVDVRALEKLQRYPAQYFLLESWSTVLPRILLNKWESECVQESSLYHKKLLHFLAVSQTMASWISLHSEAGQRLTPSVLPSTTCRF